MIFAFFILAAVLLLILVSGGYVFFVACRRGKELPWLDAAGLKGTPVEKYSDSIQSSHQWLISHNARDVTIQSHDGLTLHGLWVPAENPKGTLLFAHGYRSTYLVDFGPAFNFYHSLGLNLLIPSQRCHGKSQGKYITFGVRESEDMLGWIEFHNRKFGSQPVILSGMSMGASTVLYLADRDLPPNVRGIIADCGFTSPKEIMASVFRRVTHLPAGVSLFATDLFARILAGFRLNEKDTQKSLIGSRVPVLMVHGTADTFVPCEMSQRGYAACTGQKQLLLVEGAEHGVSFLVDRERYREAIVNFLHTNMEGLL